MSDEERESNESLLPAPPDIGAGETRGAPPPPDVAEPPPPPPPDIGEDEEEE